jgi:hypothetical protein
MSIVGAFDVHRRQLTFEYLDTVTGELRRGRVAPADREHLRDWLARFAGQDDVHFALEGCTGWRYVVEELLAAGAEPHLAEPADTAALRGRKRHAKTDKTDSRHLRVHLLAGDLPECWIPPQHVLEVRAVVRLYKDLLDERGAWHERIAATLFHQGVPAACAPPTARETPPRGNRCRPKGPHGPIRRGTHHGPARHRLPARPRRHPHSARGKLRRQTQIVPTAPSPACRRRHTLAPARGHAAPPRQHAAVCVGPSSSDGASQRKRRADGHESVLGVPDGVDDLGCPAD